MRIKGVYPPIVTPFDEQGRLHDDALASNIEKWDDTGLSGYVVAPSTKSPGPFTSPGGLPSATS